MSESAVRGDVFGVIGGLHGEESVKTELSGVWSARTAVKTAFLLDIYGGLSLNQEGGVYDGAVGCLKPIQRTISLVAPFPVPRRAGSSLFSS